MNNCVCLLLSQRGLLYGHLLYVQPLENVHSSEVRVSVWPFWGSQALPLEDLAFNDSCTFPAVQFYASMPVIMKDYKPVYHQLEEGQQRQCDTLDNVLLRNTGCCHVDVTLIQTIYINNAADKWNTLRSALFPIGTSLFQQYYVPRHPASSVVWRWIQVDLASQFTTFQSGLANLELNKCVLVIWWENCKHTNIIKDVQVFPDEKEEESFAGAESNLTPAWKKQVGILRHYWTALSRYPLQSFS